MISCLICMSTLETGMQTVFSLTSCGHIFHGSCIVRWVKPRLMLTDHSPRPFLPFSRRNQMVWNVSDFLPFLSHLFFNLETFRHPTRTCPKCRCTIPALNGFSQIFFEQSGDVDFNESIQELLNENMVHRRKIDLHMKEISKSVSFQTEKERRPRWLSWLFFQMLTIESNVKEITALYQHKMDEDVTDTVQTEQRPIAMSSVIRDVAVLLSRSDEEKRIQEYFDRYRANH